MSSRSVTGQELLERLKTKGQSEQIEPLFAKLGFSADFVAGTVLGSQGPVTVSRVAMLWQGMPNKHDRKRTRALFDALTDIGLLTPVGDEETWTIVNES